MKKLCIFIPTRNHPDLMNYFFQETESGLSKFDIDLFIYDTSEDNATSQEVKQLNNPNIKYYRNDQYSDTTTDLKIVEGFDILMDDYEYIWLCGDGYVPVLEEVIPKILKYMENSYNVIHFIPAKYIEGKKSFDMDKIDFFRYCGWYTPYFGTTIISSTLFNNSDLKALYNKMNNSGFIFWFALHDALAKLENEKIIALDCESTYTNNPEKKTSSAANSGRFTKFWLDEWPRAIQNLPDCYNEYKDLTCKMVGNETFFPDMYHFMIQRITNNISFSIIKKYKKNIPKLTDAPMWKFYITAMVPIALLKTVKAIKHKKKALR